MTPKIGLLIVLGVMAGSASEMIAGGLVTGGESEVGKIQAAEIRPPKAAAGSNERFDLKFRDAPLAEVLERFSRVAGLVIVSAQSLREHIDLWSDTSVTRDEAIDLLNESLTAQGASAV